MSEERLVVMAAAVWIGASIGVHHGPALDALTTFTTFDRLALVITVAAAVVAVLWRSSFGFAVALAILAVQLGMAADRAYVPIEAGPISEPMTVLSDPRPRGPGWLVELRLPGGQRVHVTAFGRSGAVVAASVVGETLMVDGLVSSREIQPWLRTKHITGQVGAATVAKVSEPGLLHSVPQFVRSRIAAGADHLSDRARALYLGLVIGDDRLQPLGQRLRFKGAGLSHLLAVSGQNVALAVAVARPALRLVGYRGRFLGLVTVLVLFAVVTRLEPSVLRATAAALIAAWAGLTGRERSGVAILAGAVMVLIVIDPFLVDAVGFQLSVAASAGILIVGPVLERRVPGPRWLVVPLATTVAAQLAVSPILAAHFGPVSLASVPANLLAGWAAAAIMTIGLTVGVVAGLLPGPVTEVLQAPAELLLWWIEAVATHHAALNAPRVGGPVFGAIVALVLLSGLIGRVPLRVIPLGMATLMAAASITTAPSGHTVCGEGIEWYGSIGDAPSVMVLAPTAYDRSIEDCLNRGIRHVDLLVLERGGAASARLATALRELLDVGATIAPPQHRVIGARRVTIALEVPTVVGPMTIAPSPTGTTLVIDVDPGGTGTGG